MGRRLHQFIGDILVHDTSEDFFENGPGGSCIS